MNEGRGSSGPARDQGERDEREHPRRLERRDELRRCEGARMRLQADHWVDRTERLEGDEQPGQHSVQPITLRARATISSSIDAYNTPAKTPEGLKMKSPPGPARSFRATTISATFTRARAAVITHATLTAHVVMRSFKPPSRRPIVTPAGGPGRVTGPDDVPAPRRSVQALPKRDVRARPIPGLSSLL